jgi:hypothetical protein
MTLPSWHRPGDAFDLDGAEVAALEQIAEQPVRACGDYDRVRFGQGLQAGREVRGLTDDRVLLRRAFAYQIADHHQPGRDSDAGSKLTATNRVDRAQPRPDCPLSVVLMRMAGIGASSWLPRVPAKVPSQSVCRP